MRAAGPQQGSSSWRVPGFLLGAFALRLLFLG